MQNSSRGYILITLMLFMTLLTIAMVAALPEIAHQIQRDREEEMLHRGTEYMRAIKRYYKKFGRYPTRIEELENTNQQRFIRKRYKDPLLTKGEKEFKLVRVGDPLLNNLGMGGAGLGQGIAPVAGQNPGPGQALMQGGRQPGFVGAAGGGVRPATPDDANTPQATGLPGQQGAGTAGSDSENADAKSSADTGPAPSGQVFGGGPILGVASTSKQKTIREFNKKNHYNDWLFIYDPASDRGGLLRGPIQPDANRNAGIGMGGGVGGSGAVPTPPAQPGQSVMTPPAGAPPGQQQEPPEE